MSPFDRANIISYSTLIEAIAFGTPLGVILVEFRRDLWHQKNRLLGLSCGFVCVILAYV